MNNREHFERTFTGKLPMSRCDMVPELYAMERTQVAWEAYQEGTCRPGPPEAMPQILAALRWYADKHRYRPSWNTGGDHAMEDRGQQARNALERYDNQKKQGNRP